VKGDPDPDRDYCVAQGGIVGFEVWPDYGVHYTCRLPGGYSCGLSEFAAGQCKPTISPLIPLAGGLVALLGIAILGSR
jgi:hypothetical protein